MPKRSKEGSEDGARALVKAAAPARKASQPGSVAGITSGGGVAARCEHRVPPRLEGRGVHRGQGKLILTSVATCHSVGTGEEGWHDLSARRKKTAVRRRGNRGSWRARRRQVRLLPTGYSDLRGRRRSLGRPPIPFPLLLLLLRQRCGQRRISPPRRLGLGEPRGAAVRLLIAAGAWGHVDDQDAVAVRGARRDGAMAGSPTLWRGDAIERGKGWG
jgi:hypothetical protein